MEDLDLREILKDVPRGTKLYSTTHGDICFDCVDFSDNVYPIKCYEHCLNYVFTKEGKYHYNYDGECCLFPSKEQRDWSKFELPCQFKIGDVLTGKRNSNSNYIAIFYKADCIPGCTDPDVLYYYCYYAQKYEKLKIEKEYGIGSIKDYRLATNAEKCLLYDKLQENEYFWNNETNSLDKYRFKVGDKIQDKTTKQIYTIYDIEHNKYKVKENIQCYLFAEYQDNYELYQEKFDITTLKPYDKVLVRYNNDSAWRPQIFSYLDIKLEHNNYKFAIIGLYSIPQCIPYEGNEHLVGTTNDCDDFYKTW